MRKTLSMLLILALMLTMSAAIFAEGVTVEDGETSEIGETTEIANYGGATVEEVHLGSDTNKMRLLLVGDTHYTCGENPLYNYPYITRRDSFGIDHEEKTQELIDGILAENYIDEVDAVLFLGDLANNDKPFQRYSKMYRDNVCGGKDFLEFTDAEWTGWYNYMMTEFYKSEYDCIYWFNERYLSQLSAAGIPYYVIPGNHDGYTTEMWKKTFGDECYDKDGNLVQDANMYFTYREDGSLFSSDYMLTFPEFDTAISMLDIYNYEDDPVTHKPVDRFINYIKGDCVLYTPVHDSGTREANFMGMVEMAKDYTYYYICGHHYNGQLDYPATQDCVEDDWIAKTGNKYGNLRLLIYAHDHFPWEVYGTKYETDNGIVPIICTSHWSTTESASYYDKDTGEKVPLFGSLRQQGAYDQNSWGYNVIEQTASGGVYYKIFSDMTYEYQQSLKDYLERTGIWGYKSGDCTSTPYELPYTVEYRRTKPTTIYTKAGK